VPELLGPAVLVGWLVLSPRIGGHRPPGIFWAFLVLVVGLRAVQFRNGRVALEVGPKGIRLGQTANRYSRRLVAVPWRSIAEVVVLAPRMSAPEDLATNVGEVGVRLRPGAPLPAGVRGIVREPGGTGPLVTRPLRGSTPTRPGWRAPSPPTHRACGSSSCRPAPDGGRGPAADIVRRRPQAALGSGAGGPGQLNGVDLPPVFVGVPVIFAVVGSMFVILGLRSAASLRRFRRTAARASGVVLDLVLDVAGPRRSTNLVYFPVVRFSTPDGRVVDFRSPQGSSPAAVRRGQQVDVLYDPADPTNARLEGILSGGCLNTFLVVFGGVFVLLAVVIALTGLFVVRAVNR